jgi:two-component system nitrate/nitrite response regulator NarL
MIHNSSCIHIVVAVSDLRCRSTLLAALHSEPGFCVIGEAFDEAELFSLRCQLQPSILFLDSNILLATVIDEEHVRLALQLRARAIVQKTAPAGDLLKTIYTVLENKYCMGADSVAILIQILHALIREHKTEFFDQENALTAQEHNVVAMIAEGHSNKEIGLALSISERTVKHHLTSVFGKLGLSSRLQLAVFATTHRLGNPGRAGTDITVASNSSRRGSRRPHSAVSLIGS